MAEKLNQNKFHEGSERVLKPGTPDLKESGGGGRPRGAGARENRGLDGVQEEEEERAGSEEKHKMLLVVIYYCVRIL